MKENKIIFKTNTAYLLNMWFKESDCNLWKEVRDWIEEKHKDAWKNNNTFEVEGTFKVKKLKSKIKGK